MSHWDEFDHVIVNDDFEDASARLASIIGGRGEATSTRNPALRRAVADLLAG
jgi:guanylate kinase